MPITGEFYKVKRRHFFSGCKRKRRCGNEVAAIKLAKRMALKHPGERFDAYNCDYCGDWHVGHDEQGVGINTNWKP